MSDYGLDKICVEFAGEAQQNVLAELCSICRAIKYKELINSSSDSMEVGDEIKDLVERFNITPQQWDEMYDVLHRSGWNA